MSIASIYVRARDGALYKNPLFVFDEGFLCFDDHEPPEIVIWIPPAEAGNGNTDDYIGATLAKIKGRMGRCVSIVKQDVLAGERSERVIPGTDPFEFCPAASFYVDVVGRIPIPTNHEGCERYHRNCTGVIYDWPPHHMDAHELDVSE